MSSHTPDVFGDASPCTVPSDAELSDTEPSDTEASDAADRSRVQKALCVQDVDQCVHVVSIS